MIKRILTNEEIKEIQQMADVNNILLHTELNVNVDSKINKDEQDDEILMPIGLI